MSRFVSLMVPLRSGQSTQILLESVDRENDCIRCQDEASVVSDSGQLFMVGQCSSCSFDSHFSNGLGMRIPNNTTITEYFSNESSYSMSMKHWIDAYMCDELSNYIDKYYTYTEIEQRISYLIDNYSVLDFGNTLSEKTLRLARHKLDLVSGLESLSISERVIKRAKKNL